ncbi:MAG: aldehyde ferredoxin oxidoreductase C-terminal domain-containing protein, partial [bacterium]
MEQSHLKTLMIDSSNGFYKILRYPIGDFWGPVDLGIHLAKKYDSLNIGTGLLAGSIFPGSNRLIFNGFSPSWHGFYISSMGGAGLVFDNLGLNMVSIIGKASTPSVIYLNRIHGEEIEVEIVPVRLSQVWEEGRKGVYSLMQHTLDLFKDKYENDPRVLSTGPASRYTDFGAIASAPIRKGEVTYVDCWAGRGGFGTKLLQQHGIAAIIFGGTYVDEDFRDRKVADSWFQDKYQKKLSAKDLETTTKYRYDPAFNTGGTFGVNFTTLQDYIIAFNYKTIHWTDEQRLKLHQDFILNHYLKQFNEETIVPKQQKTCGEPCAAVCKKLNNHFKKDYEPYQTMGPLCGIFDQRAAELTNQKADSLGFDAISVGGVLAWLMECVAEGLIMPEELGLKDKPRFEMEGFELEEDSMHNANIAMSLLDEIARPGSRINLMEGARKYARNLARKKGIEVLNRFIYNAFARHGWMVPNQYWTPGVLSPMGIMGKYYNDYGKEFLSPRQLGNKNAQRMIKEIMLDNTGICRFHRAWAEDIMPDIIDKLFGQKEKFLRTIALTASRINSRNASVFWESKRNIEYVHTFFQKKLRTGDKSPELQKWVDRFDENPHQA